jgi:hypothetical protein
MFIRTHYSKCPNCGKKISVWYQDSKNLGKCVKIDCYDCGFYKFWNEDDINCIQPINPLFKVVYGYDPIEDEKKNSKKLKEKKDNQKQEREDRIKFSKLKPWQKKDIKSYVRDRNLED